MLPRCVRVRVNNKKKLYKRNEDGGHELKIIIIIV